MGNPDRFIVPAEPVEAEILVVNSRFIASLSPVKSVEEARLFQKEIKRRYNTATHHVPIFVIGHGNSVITHSSDDGEPSGTAGRPALDVLQGSGLGNVAVIITRYFGGTKLGTGGLVKAYGDAVREVLSHVKRAELLATTTLEIELAYSFYEQILRLVQKFNGQILDTSFKADVTMIVRFKDENKPEFENQLINLSAGKIQPKILQQDADTPFPL